MAVIQGGSVVKVVIKMLLSMTLIVDWNKFKYEINTSSHLLQVFSGHSQHAGNIYLYNKIILTT